MKQMTAFGPKDIDAIKEINISNFMREVDKFKFGEELIEVYPAIDSENKVNIKQRKFNSEILNKYFKGYMTKNKKIQKESIINLYKHNYLSLIIELKTGNVYEIKDKDDKNDKNDIEYIINIDNNKKKNINFINNMDFIVISMKVIEDNIDLKLNTIVEENLYNIYPEHIKLEDMKLKIISLIKDIMNFFDEYTIDLIKKSIKNYEGECPILNGKKNLLDSLGLKNKINEDGFVECDSKNSYFMLS